LCEAFGTEHYLDRTTIFLRHKMPREGGCLSTFRANDVYDARKCLRFQPPAFGVLYSDI
jgi:hypothetical protein